MKYSRILLAALFFSHFFSPLTAQTGNPAGTSVTELPNIIPPSPTVANLMKFEEIPIDYYSGQPDISIPLYSKRLDANLEFGMSLRYSTTGIRIESRSGWTGTGWSLAAGGTVSRTVRGVIDDKLKDPNNWEDVEYGLFHVPDFWNWDNLTQEEKLQYAWNVKGTRYLQHDSQPDLYQYSCMGLSGRFVVVKQANTLVAQQLDKGQPVKIVLNYDAFTFKINSFSITDGNGYSYVFDEQEVTSSVTTNITFSRYFLNTGPSPQRPENEFVSSWHLSSVTSPTGIQLLEIEYETQLESYRDAPNVIKSEVPPNLITFSEENPYNLQLLKPHVVTSYNDIEVETKKISKVFFKDGTKLIFNSSSPLTHPETAGTYLANITLNNDNGIIREIDLDYEITTTNDRLWLTEVENGDQVYALTYHDKELLPAFFNEDFPQTLTNPSDDWGYMESYFPGKQPGHSFNEYNPENHVVGLLATLQYPTKGKAHFTFEPHTYSWEGASQITNFDANPQNHIISYAWAKFHATNTYCNTIVNGVEGPTLPTVEISHEQKVFVNTNTESGDEEDFDLHFHKVGDPNFEAVVRLVLPEASRYAVLPPGSYTYELKTSLVLPVDPENPGPQEPITNQDIVTTISLNYLGLKSIGQYGEYLIGGGVRIKKIDYKKEDQLQSDLSAEFTYMDDPYMVVNHGMGSTALSLSSGGIDGRVELLVKRYWMDDRKYLFTQEYSCPDSFFPTHLPYRVEEKGINAGLSKGVYINYKQVTAKRPGNGKSKFKYSSTRDYPTNLVAFHYPFLPSLNLDYKRGLLLLSETYDESGTKLDSITNQYAFEGEQVLPTFTLNQPQCEWTQFYKTRQDYLAKLNTDNVPVCAECNFMTVPCLDEFDNCGILFPYLLLDDAMEWGWAKKTQSTQTQFFSNGSITKTSSYVYNPVNYQVEKETISYTEGGAPAQIERTFTYPVGYDPGDFTSPEITAMNGMENLHMLNVPVMVEEKKNGTELSKVKHAFQGNGLLSYTQFFKGSASAPESKFEFSSYDFWGNPQEIEDASGKSTVYIWGYNGSYPIAKIENATLLDVSTALGLSGMGSVNFDESDMPALNSLRTLLPEALVTTLEYTPGIGVTRVTDTKGDFVTYVYDGMGRLVQTVNAQNEIVSDNIYHFKN